jgi:DnaA-homolog protein
MSQLALDLLQPLQPSFDNFVPGRNGEALDALRRIADGRLADRIVYLWGDSGSGRSHLLAALTQATGAYVWNAVSPPDQPGLALVDNVDRLDDAAQVALFNRLNAVRAHDTAACVIAGSAPPARLALREDLRTRLAWGLVYQLHPLTDAEKAEALRTHAAATGLNLPDEVLGYLLTHLPRDLRTLVAALDALDAHALARKRPLSVALLRDWLQLRLDAPGT